MSAIVRTTQKPARKPRKPREKPAATPAPAPAGLEALVPPTPPLAPPPAAAAAPAPAAPAPVPTPSAISSFASTVVMKATAGALDRAAALRACIAQAAQGRALSLPAPAAPAPPPASAPAPPAPPPPPPPPPAAAAAPAAAPAAQPAPDELLSTLEVYAEASREASFAKNIAMLFGNAFLTKLQEIIAPMTAEERFALLGEVFGVFFPARYEQLLSLKELEAGVLVTDDVSVFLYSIFPFIQFNHPVTILLTVTHSLIGRQGILQMHSPSNPLQGPVFLAASSSFFSRDRFFLARCVLIPNPY